MYRIVCVNFFLDIARSLSLVGNDINTLEPVSLVMYLSFGNEHVWQIIYFSVFEKNTFFLTKKKNLVPSGVYGY